MKTYFRLALTVIIILSILAIPIPVKASVFPIDLGTLGVNPVMPWESIITIKSWVSARINGNEHAFLWENGVMTDLGALVEWGSSNAFAINDPAGWSVDQFRNRV